MKSQCERLLAYLQSGKTITPLDAWQTLGIYRLSARIFELRKDHSIAGPMVKRKNRWNEEFKVCEYRMNGQEQRELGL